MIDTSVKPLNTTPQSMSWFDSIKHSFLNVWHKITDSKNLIFDVLLFFGVGFLIGFFLRKYGQYIAAIIIFMVCLVILAQLNIVDIGINWAKISQLMGIKQPVMSEGQALFTMYFDWFKAHVMQAASLCVGFLIGLRIG